MAYGVLLEYATIQSYHSYSYGRFLLMVGGAVPLCIGVSWGIIIYSAMATSDQRVASWWLRPWVDALLALLIDLSMDAVAIRLGFWTWGRQVPGSVCRWAISMDGSWWWRAFPCSCGSAGRWRRGHAHVSGLGASFRCWPFPCLS